MERKKGTSGIVYEATPAWPVITVESSMNAVAAMKIEWEFDGRSVKPFHGMPTEEEDDIVVLSRFWAPRVSCAKINDSTKTVDIATSATNVRDG